MFEMDISKVLSNLDLLIDKLPATVDEALQECAQDIAKEESTRTKGKLSESFITYKEDGNWIIDNTKDYAKYIEFGRGPVRAINAKALRFVIDGEVFFRKSVGPAKAQPFVKESMVASEPHFRTIFDKHLKKIIK